MSSANDKEISIPIKLSIIVPVFNGEAYISRCLNSIVNQTETKIEVIVVNDGSQDQTAKLVDEFCLIDKRIKVIHKENGGLSSARNAGLRIAVGEYIMFVDGDDWLSCNAVENLYVIVQRYNADILRFMWVIEDTNRKLQYIEQPLYENLVFFQDNEIRNNLVPILLSGSILNSCCKNIVRNKLIKDNKLKFDENQMYGEDLLFTLELLSYAKSYLYLPESYYHYYKNSCGLTGLITEQKILCVIRANMIIHSYLVKWKMDTNENCNLFRERSIRSITLILIALNRDNRVNFQDKYRVTKRILKYSAAQVSEKYIKKREMRIHEDIAIWMVKKQLALLLIIYCIGLEQFGGFYQNIKHIHCLVNKRVIP